MHRKPKVIPVPTVRVPVSNGYGGEVSYSGFDLEGSPDEVISLMESIKTQHPDKELMFAWQQAHYDDSYSLNLFEIRPENEGERKLRADKEAEARRRQEDYDRHQYERLLEKYGKSA